MIGESGPEDFLKSIVVDGSLLVPEFKIKFDNVKCKIPIRTLIYNILGNNGQN